MECLVSDELERICKVLPGQFRTKHVGAEVSYVTTTTNLSLLSVVAVL